MLCGRGNPGDESPFNGGAALCGAEMHLAGGGRAGDPLADLGPLTCSCIDCRERLEGDARDPLFMLPSKAPDPMSCTAMTCARASEPCGEGDKVLRA